MDHIGIASESQENIHVQSKMDCFFDRFRVGTLLHPCGVRKRHGHGVRSLTQAIFTLPSVGKNFFRGTVINEDLPFGKDAAYQLLKGTTYNRRRLILRLGQRLHSFFNRLTDEDRETVLIIDDSSYDRSRSKLVELLCRVYDHSTGRFLNGCRDEVSDISFIEALYRILTLAVDQLKNIGNFCEKTASAFFDAIMNTALHCVGLSKNNLIMNPES
jgi:hypothetical protein